MSRGCNAGERLSKLLFVHACTMGLLSRKRSMIFCPLVKYSSLYRAEMVPRSSTIIAALLRQLCFAAMEPNCKLCTLFHPFLPNGPPSPVAFAFSSSL